MFRLVGIAIHTARPVVAILAAVVLVALHGGQARGQAARDAGAFLVDLTERAVDQLTEPGLAADEQERRFRGLVKEGFDVPAIGRFVLGRYWRRARAQDQAAFLATFEDLLVNRFLPLFSQYSGETVHVGRVRPFKNNPDFVNVSSELQREEGEPIHIDWRVRRRENTYKIVDVVTEGVSVAVTLRSEYASILKQNSGDVGDLVSKMRGRMEKL